MELKELDWFCKHEKCQKRPTLYFNEFLHWIQQSTSSSMWVLLSFKTRNTKFPLFYDCCAYENISCLFDDSANNSKAFNLKVNCEELRLVFVHHVNTECTWILETVWKCWSSALLCNIHKYNNLVVILREFVWDNYFQIMFIINTFLSL